MTGWAVFTVAATVYIQTVEATASWWDCGEFIAASYKLLIGHPPGAPFFLLVGRLFSLLAGNDVTKVAYWLNILSALCSAFTILFLFWTIVLLGKKLIPQPKATYTSAQAFGLLASGVIGALAYAFSDTFWFSAVEAEVYAMSSLFTAFVVWAMLRWERADDESTANRWLLLIAYAVGLSIGTHLLNLVALPALAFIYYFKKYKPSWKGNLLTLVAGGVLVMGLMVGMRTGLPSLAGSFDIFFVNTLGLPFGSGVVVFGVLFLGILTGGIRYSIVKHKVLLNTALLGFTFVLIGYTSYTIILVRANFNPPFNLNNPHDVPGFMYYLNMEQYGAGRPLLYGPDFTADILEYKKGAPNYVKGKDKYEAYDYRYTPVYDRKHLTLFPRLYSRDRNYPEAYRQLLGLREGEKPIMADNLHYFFTHQLGHMYGRYFMWNFAGRDNDQQDAGWQASLQLKSSLPSDMAQNKAHNRLYLLPLILGILGLCYQYYKHRQSFIITALLFVLTGIALVVYLNAPPIEPRERDYIYVGSFYAFTIWIGLGVLALSKAWERVIKWRWSWVGPLVTGSVCALVPLILATQNWNDHDRSGRYVAVDSARNMLNSCAPNAILFTAGDNDTYPLIYAQEVEGVRPDVRICITQFMGTDWYIDHLKRKTYEGEALPISLKPENYIASTNNQILYVENPNVKEGINLAQYIKLIRENNPALQVTLQSGDVLPTLPSHKLVIPLNKNALLRQQAVPEELESLVDTQMVVELNKSYLLKDDLVFLDILAHNNWKRPLYFTSIATAAKYNLAEFTQVEGVVCRLLPVKVPEAKQGFVNSAVAYDNLMNKCAWRGLDNPEMYYEEHTRNWLINSRFAFLQLSGQLIYENQPEKAREVLLHCLKVIPDSTIPYDRACSLFVAPLLQVGEKEKALAIARTMAQRADQNLAYYMKQQGADPQVIRDNLVILNQLALTLKEENQPEAARYEALFTKHYQNL